LPGPDIGHGPGSDLGFDLGPSAESIETINAKIKIAKSAAACDKLPA
jgi:hypothetical protein